VLVLFLMGGQVLRAFSFALVVGIVVGTYSSLVSLLRWSSPGIAGAVRARRQAPDPQPATKPAVAKTSWTSCYRWQEVGLMFEEMVISSPNPKKTNKPWTVVVSMISRLPSWES